MENVSHTDATPCAFATVGCASPTCKHSSSFHPGHGFRRATAVMLARRELPEDVLERVRNQPICEPCAAWGRYTPTGKPRGRPPKQQPKQRRQPLAPLPLPNGRPNGQTLPPAPVVTGERDVAPLRQPLVAAVLAPFATKVLAPAAKATNRRKSKPLSAVKSPKTRRNRLRAYGSDMIAAHKEACKRYAIDEGHLLGIDVQLDDVRVRVDFQSSNTLNAKDVRVRSRLPLT